MQIISRQIHSGTSGKLAEIKVMQQRCFELMPHNERRFLVPDDVLAPKLVCSESVFFLSCQEKRNRWVFAICRVETPALYNIEDVSALCLFFLVLASWLLFRP